MTSGLAHHRLSHRARPDVGAKVDRTSVLLEEREVFAKRSPRISRIGLLAQREVGPRRGYLAGDLACYALGDLRYGVWSAKYLEFRMPQHVDEPRGDHLIPRVDHPL